MFPTTSLLSEVFRSCPEWGVRWTSTAFRLSETVLWFYRPSVLDRFDCTWLPSKREIETFFLKLLSPSTAWHHSNILVHQAGLPWPGVVKKILIWSFEILYGFHSAVTFGLQSYLKKVASVSVWTLDQADKILEITALYLQLCLNRRVVADYCQLVFVKGLCVTCLLC